MLPTVATVNHCRQRRQAHEHFVSLLWWHQPQRCGFVCLAHGSLWLQRGRCDQTVAYKETVSSPVEPPRLCFGGSGWWNNSAVSGTGNSDLTRPSSYLLVRWKPWNRRMFRCQNDVEKYVRDVCSWSCSGDKSTETVRDLLRHVILPFWQVNQTYLRLCRLQSTSSTVNKAADCSCAGSCMDRSDFYPQHVRWHCLSSHLPMWHHEAAGSCSHEAGLSG